MARRVQRPSPLYRGYRDAYDVIEFIVPEDEAEGAVATIREIKAKSDVPIYLSALHSLATSAHEGGTFKHIISSGFPDRRTGACGRVCHLDRC